MIDITGYLLYEYGLVEAILQMTFSNEFSVCVCVNYYILIELLLTFVPKGPISNKPALVEIMVWQWSDSKPLSEPMMP